MTVISLKHNRFNLVTQKVMWQNKTKLAKKKGVFITFLNVFLMMIIILCFVFFMLSAIKMNNYRFDLKELSSQIVSLEHQNAELQNQLLIFKNFENISSLISNEKLILVNNPSYFSAAKSKTEVGIKNVNNL